MKQSTHTTHTNLPTVTNWQMWWPVVLMAGCSFLSYLDRQVLAVLSPMILPEFHLSVRDYGQIISAFGFAYMLGGPVWGALLDRVGLRRGMMVAVALWTIACGAHAMLAGFLGFAVARAVLGFGEGATFPGGLRVSMDWLPPKKQARGIAVSYSGGSLGALITPLVVIPIAVHYGWRAAFLVTGAAGLVWVVLWWRTVNFSAAAHVRLTDRVLVPNIFERRFWSLVASYALTALPIGLILYLAPLYLSRVLGFTQSELARVLWIPPLGWEIGYFFWGWLADRYAPGNRRPVWLFFTLAAIGVPQVVTGMVRGPATALALMFWAMFVASGFVIVALRTSALAYPSEQTGVVAGIASGSWSAAVAMVLPSLGHMFDMHHYANAFLFCGIVPVLGTLCWWALTLPDKTLMKIDTFE